MKITATTSEEFSAQFEELLKLESSKRHKNIVYFWKVEKPMPRLYGESNIIYIGQTSRSLQGRYLMSKDFNYEVSMFDHFYKHAIKKYGALFIECKASDNPPHAEWKELRKYYGEHYEYPPRNRAIPNEPHQKVPNK